MKQEIQILVQGTLDTPNISMPPYVENIREEALSESTAVQQITDEITLDAAGAALTKIRSIVKTVETNRKEVKAPVLDIGRQIDGLAKDFLAPLEKEGKRLSALVGSYQEAERRKAERIRQEEAARQAAALAELQAKQAEAIAKGDEEAADQTRAEAADKIAASQMAVIEAEGAKAEGISTRTSWKFEVTDIQALYKARPELCIVQPNNAAIRAIVKASNGAAIPGLRLWQETSAVVRGSTTINPENYDY